MTQEELFQLFAKYIRGEASEKEAETFLQLMGTDDAAILIQAYMKAYQLSGHPAPVNETRTDRLYLVIQSEIRETTSLQNIVQQSEKTHAKVFSLSFLRKTKQLWNIAALFIILFLSAILIAYLLPDRSLTRRDAHIKENGFQIDTAQSFRKLIKTGAYTENLLLEDHSNVIVRAGSRLGITQDFNTTERSVFLDGEAFFDVAHNAEKPFFIHTGPLMVEVLGTAFNIKSFSSQDSASVYVTRGKVLVWDKSRKLRQVLTAHQSISYQKDLQTYIVRTLNTDEQQVLAWTAKEMIFDKVSMQQVMSTLSHRYNVTVEAKDSLLLNTKVKISFNGTESLTNVMEALSLITGSAYTLREDTLRVFRRTLSDRP